jgi:hypothetical protein
MKRQKEKQSTRKTHALHSQITYQHIKFIAMLREQPLQCCFSCFIACIARCIAQCIHNRQLILHIISTSIKTIPWINSNRRTCQRHCHAHLDSVPTLQRDDRSMLPSICSLQLLLCLCSNCPNSADSPNDPALQQHDTVEQLRTGGVGLRCRTCNNAPNEIERMDSADRLQDRTNEQSPLHPFLRQIRDDKILQVR